MLRRADRSQAVLAWLIVPTGLSRRAVIAAMAAACAFPGGAAPPGLATVAPMISPTLANEAMAALFRHNPLISSCDVMAIADFGLPSAQPRLFLVDLLRQTITALLVAHGIGSDPDHVGTLQRFSDAIGSNATSRGAYLIGDAYDGVHGRSLRLAGLDPSNAHAEERAIVIHSAWYADAEMIAWQGKLGRSDGCFAVGQKDMPLLVAKLGKGRLFYAGVAAHG